jgi:hypothetical protein
MNESTSSEALSYQKPLRSKSGEILAMLQILKPSHRSIMKVTKSSNAKIWQVIHPYQHLENHQNFILKTFKNTSVEA